jgi:uncharacterized protein (DUF433 family)
MRTERHRSTHDSIPCARPTCSGSQAAIRLAPCDACRACLTAGNRTAHDEYMDLARITVDHQIMGGVPCVTGTRIPVATIVGLVASRLTTDEIVAEYPQLTPADVQACLEYAARAVDERELPVRLTA